MVAVAWSQLEDAAPHGALAQGEARRRVAPRTEPPDHAVAILLTLAHYAAQAIRIHVPHLIIEAARAASDQEVAQDVLRGLRGVRGCVTAAAYVVGVACVEQHLLRLAHNASN